MISVTSRVLIGKPNMVTDRGFHPAVKEWRRCDALEWLRESRGDAPEAVQTGAPPANSTVQPKLVKLRFFSDFSSNFPLECGRSGQGQTPRLCGCSLLAVIPYK